MTDMNAEKKRVEAYMLVAARKAGVPIPSGETPDEEPDFRFKDEIPALGIELSEVLRPASSNHGILPVEQESFHKEIIPKAQQDYYDGPDANPAHVNVYFTNTIELTLNNAMASTKKGGGLTGGRSREVLCVSFGSSPLS